jgi:hypothetical protein
MPPTAVTTILLLVTVALPAAERRPFAPWERARRDPFARRLEDFAYRVLHPDDDRIVRIQRTRSLLAALQEAEQAGNLAAIREQTPAAVTAARGYLRVFHSPFGERGGDLLFQRNLVERLTLATGPDPGATPAEVAAYRQAIDDGNDTGLAVIAAQAGHPLADRARVSRAVIAIRDGQEDRAEELLRPLAARAPDDPLRDEVDYLLAHCGSGADQRLAGYLAAHPTGAWWAAAKGWQAKRRLERVIGDWPAGEAGPVGAARIYPEILLAPESGGWFLEAVASLRLVWRRLPVADAAGLLADPRLALIYAHHLVTDGDERAPAAVELANRVLAGVTDPHLRRCQVQLLVQAGRGDAADDLLATITADGSAFDQYLRGRLFASLDDLPGAQACWGAVQRIPGAWAATLAGDLATRLGGAAERTGHWPEALDWYLRGADGWNLLVGLGGEVPVDAAVAWLAAHPSIVLPGGDGQAGLDLTADVQGTVAARLLIAGRLAAAVQQAPPELRPAYEELRRLEEQAVAGTDADRYALGAYWYHQGQELMLPQSAWAYWHFWTWPKAALADAAPDPALVARWQERERLLEEGNACWRALPWFERVAREATDPDLAARALYSAGTCCWWLRGTNRQLPQPAYWAWRDRHREFSRRGDGFMAALARRFPDHPLAGSTLVREAAQRVMTETF